MPKKFHINAFEVHFLELDVAGQLQTRNPPDQTKTLCPLGCSILFHKMPYLGMGTKFRVFFTYVFPYKKWLNIQFYVKKKSFYISNNVYDIPPQTRACGANSRSPDPSPRL